MNRRAHESQARPSGPSTLWQMTGKDLNAAIRVGQEPQVKIKQIGIGDAPHSLSIAPISVNIYRLAIAQAAQ